MNDLVMTKLRKLVRDIPDFPKPGIVFKDITPLLADGPALRNCIELLAPAQLDAKIDLVVAVESRGFLFGAPLACHLGIGIVPVRKPGKLPYRTVREEYALEYGSDAIEMHEDAVQGKRCLIVDDVLATGGTAAATGRLVERSGGKVVGFSFLIELGFLNGREKLGTTPIHSALTY